MLELTIISPYLIVDFEVQLSTSTNADECFPNYSKTEQPIGKGEYQKGGVQRRELRLCLKIRHFMEYEQCHPMPELTVTPIHGWL
jgi:hypothetical protein